MKKVAMIVGLAAALGCHNAEAAEWTWKSDIRYRYQSDLTDIPTTSGEHSRNRQRIRARLGVYPWINEELTGGIQLSTAGAGTETTSRNETLDDQFLPDPIYLNECFINFHPMALHGEVNFILGKRDVANTLIVENDLVWDSDLTFEGVTAQYGKDVDGKKKSGWSAVAGYYMLNEMDQKGDPTKLEKDAYVIVGQAAYSGEASDLTYQIGAGYYDYMNFDVKNKSVAATQATTAPFTYTAATSAKYSPEYDYTGKDFNILEIFGSIGGQLTEKLPWKIAGQYAVNTAQTSTNPNIDEKKVHSYLAGIKIGNAKSVGDWSLGTDYVKIERDALTILTDSDRNGGSATDLKGFKVSGAYHLVQDMTVGATYFNFSKIGDDTTRHTFMLDTVIKF